MVNDSTREYSVYISNEQNTVSGSGVLFYAGGGTLFVFTCAHVVDGLDNVRLFFLKEIDAIRDLYSVYVIDIPSSQIIYSPLDKVTEENGEKKHTEDLAIIRCSKPADLDISNTDYCLTDTRRNKTVYVQGYPKGVLEIQKLIEYLDCLHGTVVVNPEDSNRFTIRLDDPFIDSGNRVCELEGLSGAPVWDDNEETNGLLGLFTSAYGPTATLAKTHATKAYRIRSILKERFGIVIERNLEGIPRDDVAGAGGFVPVIYDGMIEEDAKNEVETWIETELTALRSLIDDLKLQKAIDKGRELVSDTRYGSLSIDSKKKVKRYLLYCYEIADMDDEFEDLESEMRTEGLLKEHDTLRQFTRSFMKKEYQQVIDAAQQCINTWDSSSRVSLLSFAKLFLLLSRAYSEDLPIEESIDLLIDVHENFTLPLDEIEDSGLAYQMIGYVYGEKYHDYAKSVRFLNKSFHIGFGSIILESLGAAYYYLGVHDATDENGIIPDVSKIDRKSLYKARECFLLVIDKADRLFWEGTIRRVGLCIYNTFVLLCDNYRILTIYPDILSIIKPLPDVDEYDFWRDIEMKQARIVSQSGRINTDDYSHLSRSDRILLNTLALVNKCSNYIEHAMVDMKPSQMRKHGLDRYIKGVIRTTERNVRIIERKDRTPVYLHLINLYGRGMLLFGWNKYDKLRYCRERLNDSDDEDLLESMDNFIFEYEAPINDVIQRYRESFQRHKNLQFWQELNHLYIRHGMMDKADEMYRELLAERKDLISDEPEYAYRAFIDYITMYRRDLKYALQCYLDAKESFRDTDIEGFWEFELRVASNMFNDPESFEIERKPFVEKGLLTDERYHRTAFIAYLANLNEEKAREHNDYIRHYPHFVNPRTKALVLDQAEIQYLSWIGDIAPSFTPPRNSMTLQRSAEVWDSFKSERWHRRIDQHLKNDYCINRTAAIDAWGLYELFENNKIDLLKRFDRIYVSHMSVIQLHEELSRTNNQKIRELQIILKSSENIFIWSAGFKAQLEVRNVAVYVEPASALALGVEKGCLVILGAPLMDKSWIDHFSNIIIRVSDLEKLVD